MRTHTSSPAVASLKAARPCLAHHCWRAGKSCNLKMRMQGHAQPAATCPQSQVQPSKAVTRTTGWAMPPADAGFLWSSPVGSLHPFLDAPYQREKGAGCGRGAAVKALRLGGQSWTQTLGRWNLEEWNCSLGTSPAGGEAQRPAGSGRANAEHVLLCQG